MNGQLTIFDAMADDAVEIAEIYAPYVVQSTATFETEAPCVEETARRITAITEAGYPFLVMREITDGRAGKVVGFGFAQRYGPRAGYRYSVETTIYVEHGSVGRGIGSRLLGALLEECERRGFRQAFAVIAESEPASVVLHARAGFFPVGTLSGAGWKHGKWLDVFIMQRALGDGHQSLPEVAAESSVAAG